MNNTFKHYGLLLSFLLFLGGPFALAQKHERPDSVSMRHVVTLGYINFMYGSTPILGYESQMNRRWSACISAGIGAGHYYSSKFPDAGAAVVNLDFRWFPVLFKHRSLSGPFLAIHSGWKTNWYKAIANGQLQYRDYNRFLDFGSNLGFQWVFYHSMTFNGQFGIGYGFGQKFHGYAYNNGPRPVPVAERGFTAQISLGAGIAF
jgi:hypothetical protein